MLGGRFFRRLGEAAMNTVLVAALVTACAINVACLLGHL